MLDSDEPDLGIDFSPEGIMAEQRRWVLCDETHIDLFVLWHNMSGMGGESIASLWRMVDEAGSAALFKDFATLSNRKKRLELRVAFRKKNKR
jgi:hypothetical protein